MSLWRKGYDKIICTVRPNSALTVCMDSNKQHGKIGIHGYRVNRMQVLLDG